MKLAEALIMRANTLKDIEHLKSRLDGIALIQEGEEPVERPDELLASSGALLERLADLVRRINRTNVRAELEPGVSISDALVQRSNLMQQYQLYRRLANAASQTVDRYSRSEIRSVRTVDLATLERAASDLAQRQRELDIRIQACNWATDLVD